MVDDSTESEISQESIEAVVLTVLMSFGDSYFAPLYGSVIDMNHLEYGMDVEPVFAVLRDLELRGWIIVGQNPSSETLDPLPADARRLLESQYARWLPTEREYQSYDPLGMFMRITDQGFREASAAGYVTGEPERWKIHNNIASMRITIYAETVSFAQEKFNEWRLEYTQVIIREETVTIEEGVTYALSPGPPVENGVILSAQYSVDGDPQKTFLVT